MYLLLAAVFFGQSVYAAITFTSPTDTELASMYTSSSGVGSDCTKGITIVWHASDVAVANNNIRVESSNKTSKLVCYKYNGVYYGSSCGVCATSPNAILPAYSTTSGSAIGPDITIFVPYLEMVDSGLLATLTSFTLTVGLDCSKTGCSAPAGSLSGTYADTKTFTVNIDNTSPTGYIGSFIIERGDASIYIDSFDTSGLVDTGSGLYRIRFYYSECGTDPDPATAGYAEFLVGTGDWVVRGNGIVNGTSYTLRATAFDKAGNQYSESTFLKAADGSVAVPVSNDDPTSSCVTPQPVSGFMSGKEGCFVATEIFGSRSNEVSIFRSFRDRHLKKHPMGVFFVKLYYRSSPFLIKLVREYPFLRFMAYSYLKGIYKLLKITNL